MPIFYFQIEKTPQRFAPVKIIEEPIEYLNSLYTANHNRFNLDNEEDDLKPKFKPAKFSGPPFLAQLNGQCFDYLNNKYYQRKYIQNLKLVNF